MAAFSFSLRSSAALLSLALLFFAAARSSAEGIHGGTAPNFTPLITSERGTMPSFRSDMPSLSDRLQFDRWDTPFMPVSQFSDDRLPTRPSFDDSKGPSGWYDPQPMGPGGEPQAFDGTFHANGSPDWDRAVLNDPFFREQLPPPRRASGFYTRGPIGLLPYPALDPADDHRSPGAATSFLELPERPGGPRGVRGSASASPAPDSRLKAASPPAQPNDAAVQLAD